MISGRQETDYYVANPGRVLVNSLKNIKINNNGLRLLSSVCIKKVYKTGECGNLDNNFNGPAAAPHNAFSLKPYNQCDFVYGGLYSLIYVENNQYVNINNQRQRNNNIVNHYVNNNPVGGPQIGIPALNNPNYNVLNNYGANIFPDNDNFLSY